MGIKEVVMTNGTSKAPIKKSSALLAKIEGVLSTGETILQTVEELAAGAKSTYSAHRRLLTALAGDLRASFDAARSLQEQIGKGMPQGAKQIALPLNGGSDNTISTEEFVSFANWLVSQPKSMRKKASLDQLGAFRSRLTK
jgi:hypothetical protein